MTLRAGHDPNPDPAGCCRQPHSPGKVRGQGPEVGHCGCRPNPDAGGHHRGQRWPHLEETEEESAHLLMVVEFHRAPCLDQSCFPQEPRLDQGSEQLDSS